MSEKVHVHVRVNAEMGAGKSGMMTGVWCPYGVQLHVMLLFEHNADQGTRSSLATCSIHSGRHTTQSADSRKDEKSSL